MSCVHAHVQDVQCNINLLYAVLRCVQSRKENSSMDALWLMSNCSVSSNTVFHGLLLSIGNRTSWREYISRRAEVLEAGSTPASQASAEQLAAALPLENMAAAWWIVGSRFTSNKLAVHKPAAAGYKVPLQQKQQQQAGRQEAALASAAAAGATGDFWTEWAFAVNGADYAQAVSIAIAADPDLQAELAAGGATCYHALHQAYQDAQVKLALQRSTHARLPAVLWTTFNHGYLADCSFSGNTGFSHVLRNDNTMVTWFQVELLSNEVDVSVVDMWYGDVWVERASLTGNLAHNGSILDLESVRGSFEQVGHVHAPIGHHLQQAACPNSFMWCP